jgi:cysteine-rich repeat protein
MSAGVPRAVARRRRGSPLALWALLGSAFACGGAGSPNGQTPPPPPTAPAVCGNGALEQGEECDDGNAASGDGCLATCFRPIDWVEGDTHIHGHGCEGDDGPGQLVERLVRRRLAFGSALVWGEGYQEDRPYFSGRDAPESVPGHVLHYDLEISEFPAQRGGHLILLGLRSIDFSQSPFLRPYSGIPVADWARAQDALIGLSHSDHWPADGSFPKEVTDCCIPFELPVHAVRGYLAFIESTTSRVSDASLLLWSLLQNSGLRVALVGSSDFPCFDESLERSPRTSAFLEDAAGYQGWLDALRRGRAVLSRGRGEGLNLRAGAARLGEEMRVRAGEPVRLSVEASFDEPGEVQVLANGQGVGRVMLGAGIQAAVLEVTLAKSAWLVARSERSLTNPVYVLVDGRPIRDAGATCYWMRYLDHLSSLVQRRILDMDNDTDEALAAYRDARRLFEERHAEAGGGECR